MEVLDLIKQPIKQEMEALESLLAVETSHKNVLLSSLVNHISNRRGKLLRPILTLLSAKRFGEIDDSILHAAIVFEILHTASLVHDDVVDESNVRRGQASVNSLFGNKEAVLVGDYLLSVAMEHASLSNSQKALCLFAKVGQALAGGELLQLSNLNTNVISEEQYFDVIKGKTASMFAACSSVGAMLVGANEADVDRMRAFGEYVGLCFQIRDDIFDYYGVDVGKPTGKDMKEGKLTLPVIYSVLSSDDSNVLDLAIKVRKSEANDDEIDFLVELSKKKGGIDYAFSKMEKLKSDALALLSDFRNDEVDQSLRLYLDFVLKRDF